MDDLIRNQLNQAEVSPFHKAMLQHCRTLVEMSRRHMCTFYDQWDKNYETFRAQSEKTREDIEAESRSEPTKQIIPITYAQTMTFVSFCMTLYLQRQRVFEIIATGEEDYLKASIAEALLERDLTWNQFDLRLYQFLLNVARYGIGIFKTCWWEVSKEQDVEIELPAPQLFGADLGAPTVQTIKQSAITYQGNKIVTPSPYRFFPDPRMPLSRLQEGEFVASEEWFTESTIRQWEFDGSVAGIEHIKPFTNQGFSERLKRSRTGSTVLGPEKSNYTNLEGKTSPLYVVTECQVAIIPSKFEIEPGVPLGPEKHPVKYNVWYVNDERIIKCEPLGYAHDEFTYQVGEYSPDQEDLVSDGLCDSVEKLQGTIDWFINSHVASVTKIIDDRLVVDPSVVNWDDIAERRAAIRLVPQAAGTDVNKALAQLKVQDVTSAHMADANALHAIVQVVTGINDNALGQFHTGRRTAEEARTVNSATAARLKCLALIIFRAAMEPLARQMLSNHQQGLTEETYIRVIGDFADPAGYQQFKAVTKADLAGRFDFGIFDGTLPSERGQQAMALQEFLAAAMQNPQAVMLMGFDPRKIVEEWLTLRGIRHPKRLYMDAIRQQELLLQMQQTGITNANPEPTPAEQGGNTNPAPAVY